MRIPYLAGNRIIDTTNRWLAQKENIGKIYNTETETDLIYPPGAVFGVFGLGGLTAEEGGFDDPAHVNLSDYLATTYNLRLSRLQYQLLCLRIRAFTLDFTCSLVGSSSATITRTFSGRVEVRKSNLPGEAMIADDPSLYRLAESERDLVGYPTFAAASPDPHWQIRHPDPSAVTEFGRTFGLRSAGFRVSNPSDSNSVEGATLGGSGSGNNNYVVIRVFDDYFPFSLYDPVDDVVNVPVFIVIEMSDAIGFGAENLAGLVSNLLRSSTSLPAPTIGTVVFDFGATGTADVALTGAPGSFSGTMTPVEWWAYSTRSGLPVYDIANGDQINDPLS